MIAIACIAAWAALSQTEVFPPERRVLMPLDYHGARVTGGMLRRLLDEAKDDYLRIPNDDLLMGFRKRAGLPAPGHELGGWYSNDVFHVFGQILSGLSRMYAATGDPQCKAKADALLDEWTRCIAKDGYFYYTNHPNAPHYTYEKMVGGLVDMAVYAGRRDAMLSLARITRWAERNLDRKNVYSYNAGDGPTEWYTLSENLYRAYLVTGDVHYRDFAKVWEYTDYWKLYANKQSLFDKRPDGGQTGRYHAYSHVNTLSGAALAYRVRGDSWYLDTIRNAYDYLQANECFATGGFGPDESLVPKQRLEQMLRDTTATFETQCGTWAVFKLCKSLISLTGDARFGDWVEQTAYNGIGASIPMAPNGSVFYYSNYNPYGAVKTNVGDGWTCCTGTRPMAIADVCDLIYFQAKDGIDVNLFVPSTAQFQMDGRNVSIRQDTRFPEASDTTFTVHVNKPKEFSLRFRRPGWLAGPATVKVSGRNGRPTVLIEDSEHWLVLRRKWHDGDQVVLNLPMNFRSVPLYPGKPSPTAIAIGPTVLAFRGDDSPANLLDYRHLASNFVTSPGEALTYHLRRDATVLVRPFYAYKDGENYFLYLDSEAPGHVPHQRFHTDGPWNDGGKHSFCNKPGSWCEAVFSGTSIRLLGYLYEDAGRAEVTIDGKVVGKIDEFNPKRDIPMHWDFTRLGAGKHTLRVKVLNEKTSASTNLYINVAGLAPVK
ncbi:MAG: glycoside hydrolase family 127 protein [Fimbriimonas sp.]|nr:glycoside hydrolase family 127 protein [Fimbriimonas sp.]